MARIGPRRICVVSEPEWVREVLANQQRIVTKTRALRRAALRPERWTPEFESTLPRMAYFPFGAGPRKCIGESFAWMEGVLVVSASRSDHCGAAG